MSFMTALAERRTAPAEGPARAFGTGVDLLGLLFKGGRGAGTMTPAGVFVDQEKAEGITAFWRGVRVISTAVGTLPLLVYSRGSDGRKTPLWNERERVVWGKPNPEVSRSIFWMHMVQSAVATGNAFMRVVTVADPQAPPRKRRPIELWPVESHRVQVTRDTAGRKVYVIDGNFDAPKTDFVTGGTMVHVMGPSSDGLRGNSPVLQFARTLGLAVAEEIYQSSLLGDGSQVPGYLSTDQPITLAQAEEVSKTWDERHQGPRINKGGTPVMGKGVKWMTTQLNATDAGILASRPFTIAEIGRMFGIPLWMLGSHDKDSSWGSGLEEQFRAFLKVSLQDWVSRFQETISDELLVQKDHFAEFDTNRLTEGKLADKVSSLKGLVQVGYDPEESLQVVGLPPITHTGIVPAGASVPEPAAPDAGDAPRSEPIDLTVNVELPAVQIMNEAQPLPAPRTVTRHVIRDEHGAITEVREEG